jgi:hypothetical protein
MQKKLAARKPVTADHQVAIADGLTQYGRLFLSRKAISAERTGAPLPNDSCSKNWSGEKEKEIFGAVGADVIYDQVYGLFSEWHHWRLGAFGQLFQRDDERATFVRAARQGVELTKPSMIDLRSVTRVFDGRMRLRTKEDRGGRCDGGIPR